MWTHFFWTYVAGPVLALLPVRWRRGLPTTGHVQWESAAAVSGFLEIVAAIVGLRLWYRFEMTGEHQLPEAALMIFNFFFMNPLTWILLCFFFEGAVRMCGAAFAEDVLGTMPLCALEGVLFLVKNRREAKPGEVLRQNVKSFVDSVRERLMVARLEEVPDELHYTRSGTEEMLEVWASRRKEEWLAPKIVRVDEVYYRLEGGSVQKGARPFRYLLRRLEAGVPGWGVILYNRGEAIVKE
jgi:hypothetical protein